VQNFNNDIQFNTNIRPDRIHTHSHYTDQLQDNDAMMEAKENLLYKYYNLENQIITEILFLL
jgi:hypothetical protein